MLLLCVVQGSSLGNDSDLMKLKLVLRLTKINNRSKVVLNGLDSVRIEVDGMRQKGRGVVEVLGRVIVQRICKRRAITRRMKFLELISWSYQSSPRFS